MGDRVSVWQRVGRLVCLWSAGEEHSMAEKAELERKVMLVSKPGMPRVPLSGESARGAQSHGGGGGGIHAPPRAAHGT